MKDGPYISTVASLMGDPARASMLTALMSGQALTAGELARQAGIAPPTASGHLGHLLSGGLLIAEKQGRHRYYRIAGPDVAAAIEALMDLTEQLGRSRFRPGPKEPAMRKARVCYDHLAGERGVELFERLTRQKLITLEDGVIGVTEHGEARIRAFGIDMDSLKSARRPMCKTCLDWSERRSHMAGGLGAGLLNRIFDLKWAKRVDGTRVVRFTASGEAAFAALFE